MIKMATKILIDIQNDIKLLIAAITGFEEGEEGFRICESFALSNVKHHRYLSIDSHATKRSIAEVTKKFSVHGKYEVSKKFAELVETFLTSFDFEHHPQYDLQWSLLSFLLNLSNETNKSELLCLENLRSTKGEHSLNVSHLNQKNDNEDVDWGLYLKEGIDDFFNEYQSDSDSNWSDDEEIETIDGAREALKPSLKELVTAKPPQRSQSSLDQLSQSLAEGIESRNWLKKNVQNEWWATIDTNRYPVQSRFPGAHFGEQWDHITSNGIKRTGTLSEYQVCREILWMFHCPETMALFLKDTDSQFSIREDVSVPSLSHDAFRSILAPLTNCFGMLDELDKFEKSLYPRYNSSESFQRPPLTYEAYQRAVTRHIDKLKSDMVEMEKQLIEQDDCKTLLSLLNDLRPHLSMVKTLHEVHCSVTTDWQYNLNWKCASKLLSGLFFQMQNSGSREKANICCALYLQSLSVYLNIIDKWLSEGRFEDFREEFVIAKAPEDISLEEEHRQDRFSVRQLDPISVDDPVMQLLVHKVREMGRSIELLVSLDRIPDMWRIVNLSNVQRISLYDEFLHQVISEFAKYNPTECTDGGEISTLEIFEINEIDEVDSAIEQNIFQQMSQSDDPFLLKAFEDYLPHDVLKNDEVDGRRKHREEDLDVFERLQRISESVLPTRRVLKSVLSKILDSRYQGASKLVKDIMVAEYSLEKHLKLMRCVYMMETGHVMNKFYQLLFIEIESNPTWNNPNSLTNILEEILSQEWPETSSRWSIVVDEVRTHQVLTALDKITLHYAIGWPIGMVLNEDSLAKYNEVFRFQLKLKWALWTLDHLRFSDLEGSKTARIKDRLQHFQARRLESLRFWLIHAIGSIHSYLCGQVLQSLGFMLEKALSDADNLDTIITVHNEYLIKVHQHCLQTSEFEDLTATIGSLLEMCLHVRDRWRRGAENISPGDLDVMESSYIKYHTYLALALHNAVQHKDADYCKCMILLEALQDMFRSNIPTFGSPSAIESS